MIDFNGRVIRYSLLMAGCRLSLNTIGRCLADGIKVLWFGDQKSQAELKKAYPKFVDARYLCLYGLAPGVKDFGIIDGHGLDGYTETLKKLEKYDESFNLSQYEIEHNQSDHIIVVKAGAGSGKTTVMLARILYLLHTQEEQGLTLRDICMMTFTNESTSKMREDLTRTLREKYSLTHQQKYIRWMEEVQGLAVSTIDSTFKALIPMVGPLLGYGTDIQLHSMAAEKSDLLQDILDKKYGDSTENVSDVLGLPLHEIVSLGRAYWTACEQRGLTVTEAQKMDWGTPSGQAVQIQASLQEIFREVEDRYNDLKYTSNQIGLEDITHELARVIDAPDMGDYVTTKYRYMFCDEFQDTDDNQIRAIVALAKVYGADLFIVGDIKQSIYRFRGATDSAFKHFGEEVRARYEGAVPHIREYSLSKNYRTTSDILDTIEPFFRSWSESGFLKYSFSGRLNDILKPQISFKGLYRQVYVNNSTRQEKFLAVARKLYAESNPGETITVLVRENADLKTVKYWLAGAHIPCHIRERGTFYQSAAVKDMCRLLEALLYHHEPMYLFGLTESSYCRCKIDSAELEGFEGKAYKLQAFLLGQIKARLRWDEYLAMLQEMPFMAVLSEILDDTKPATAYAAAQYKQYTADKSCDRESALSQAKLDGLQYEADLQKLVQEISDRAGADFSTMYDICSYLRIQMETNTSEDSAQIPENHEKYIRGLTVHTAKGLQFTYVLMPIMNKDFSHKLRSDILVDKEAGRIGWVYRTGGYTNPIALKSALYAELDQKEDLDVIGDETRLLYVAMTRPEKGLYCFTGKHSGCQNPKCWQDLLPEVTNDANNI